MLQKLKTLLSAPLQIIPIIVFSLVMAASFNIYVMKTKHDDVGQYIDILETNYQESTWEEVKDIIHTSYYSSKLNSEILALKLESSIRDKYSDLDELKVQFEEDNYDDEFHQLLRDILTRDDVRNDLKDETYLTLIGTESHIISTFANTKDRKVHGLNSERIATWDEVYQILPNPEAAKSSIRKIFEQSNDIVFIQDGTSYFDETEISSNDMETLKNIYVTEGFKGLSDFSLLAASYITEDGDIFGNYDSTFMKSNDNHKIIVIQVVELSHLFENHDKLFKQLELNHEQTINTIESYLVRETLMAIAWSLFCFIISLILIGVHNAEVRRSECHCDEEE